MELGGKSPQIVFSDADVEAALPVLVNAIIQNGGQTCSAGSRVLIERPLTNASPPDWPSAFPSSSPARTTPTSTLGRSSMKSSATVWPPWSLPQGRRASRFWPRAACIPDAPAGGYYQPPVLFGSVDPQAVVAQEEVFGPVLTLFPFEGEEEAVRLANGTEFGLVAGIWTKDGARQHRMAKRVRAGQVFVNGYGAGGGIELPFGGFKKSGHGREKGFEALYDMSATKTVVFNHG
jgi:aldehyde dehydrogenase (NAD+)